MPSPSSIELPRISAASPSIRRNQSLASPAADSFMDNGLDVSRMKKMQIALVLVALVVFMHIEKDMGAFGTMSNATKAAKSPHLSPPTKMPAAAPAVTPWINDGGESPSSIIAGETPSSLSSRDDSPSMRTSVSIDGLDSDEDDDESSFWDDSSDGSSPSDLAPSYAPVTFVTKNLTVPAYIMSQRQDEFSQQRCDLTSINAWYPTSPDASWEFRAPYCVIAGVWNSGSTTLAQRLYSHPQISRDATKTNGFYKPSNFYKFASPKPKVYAARQRMYAQAYNGGLLQSSPDLVAMDVSPGYLFYAQQVSHNILCVSPWTKIVIVLRNPVERVYEQYARAKQTFGLRISLEQWIANEMQLVASSGLIGKEADSIEEKEAWKKYQSVRNMANAMGRSLYIFQLNEWLATYKEAGMDPRKEIYVIPSEVLEQEANFQGEYNKILSFLGLSTAPVYSGVKRRDPALSDTSEHVTAETRKTLEKFFKPYNKRLYALLEEEGFPEYPWKSLWKRKADDELPA